MFPGREALAGPIRVGFPRLPSHVLVAVVSTQVPLSTPWQLSGNVRCLHRILKTNLKSQESFFLFSRSEIPTDQVTGVRIRPRARFLPRRPGLDLPVWVEAAVIGGRVGLWGEARAARGHGKSRQQREWGRESGGKLARWAPEWGDSGTQEGQGGACLMSPQRGFTCSWP